MTTKPKREGQPKGKPKLPPTTQEKATIVTMTAAGSSQCKVAKAINRSRSLVKHTLDEPEIQRAVSVERRELAEEFMRKGRDVVTSINAKDIDKAGLRDKAVAAGILVDKSLVLTGEAPQPYNLVVLLDAVEAIREMRRAEDEAQRQLPPATEKPQ